MYEQVKEASGILPRKSETQRFSAYENVPIGGGTKKENKSRERENEKGIEGVGEERVVVYRVEDAALCVYAH